MTTILDNIKLVLSNDKYEDTKLRILEKVKEQILQSVSPKEKRKLESKSEGHSEWNRRKGLVNVNNGKIGDYDFSYIFKLYEVSESQKTVESLAVPPTGPPLAPAGPPAGLPPPPPLPGNQTKSIWHTFCYLIKCDGRDSPSGVSANAGELLH